MKTKIQLLLIAFLSLSSSVYAGRINLERFISLELKKYNPMRISPFIEDFVIKDSNMYCVASVSKRQIGIAEDEDKDSIYYRWAILLKCNINGNLEKDFFWKNDIANPNGAINPNKIVIQNNNHIKLSSAYYQQPFPVMAPTSLNTRIFDEAGNEISSYTDKDAPQDFFNRYRSLYTSNGHTIVIERPKAEQYTPYLALRFNEKGIFMDSTVCLPQVRINDTTISSKITALSISPKDNIGFFAINMKSVSNKPGNSYNAFYFLDHVQHVKWSIDYIDVKTQKNEKILLAQPAYYSNGDVLIIAEDYLGKQEMPYNKRLLLIRLDTNGNKLKEIVLKENYHYLHRLRDIIISDNEDVIIIGEVGDEDKPSAYIGRIDKDGKLIDEDVVNYPNGISFRKIRQFAPNSYIIVAIENHADNKADDYFVFYKYINKSSVEGDYCIPSSDVEITSISPNPSSSQVTLNYFCHPAKQQELKVEAVDILGRKISIDDYHILNYDSSTGLGTMTLNISQLNLGVSIITLNLYNSKAGKVFYRN